MSVIFVVVAVVEATLLPGGAPELAVAEHRLGGATEIQKFNNLLFTNIGIMCHLPHNKLLTLHKINNILLSL